MSWLKIYFAATWRDASSPCAWALCDDAGAVLQSGTAALAALPKCKECVLILASDRVLFLRTQPPLGARRRWQNALPFMAEEHVLTDPEDNHVVAGAVQADGQISLAVVDKAWLQRIVQACRAAQLPVRQAVAESLLPALASNTWTLVWDGAQGFVKTAATQAFALDSGGADSAPIALLLAWQKLPQPEKIVLCSGVDLPHWEGLPLVDGQAWDWRTAAIPSDALNLLSGDFAPPMRISAWLPKLRPLALIGLVALGIEIAGSNGQWAMLAQEKSKLTRDMDNTFRTAFGANVAVVNAPLQMQRKLVELHHSAGLPDTADFLPLLDQTVTALGNVPAGSIHALHYEAGRLDIDLKLPRRADLDRLQHKLSQGGRTVRLGDVHELGDGVEAQISVLVGEF
jgi:general secretion pathway protein L